MLAMEIPTVRERERLRCCLSLLCLCQYDSAISELGRYSDVYISLLTSSSMKKEGKNVH